MLAALLSPSSSNNNNTSNPSTTGRISQVLPTVKCSTCHQPVPFAELGDHKCEAPPPLPSPNPLSPLSPLGVPVPTLKKPSFTPETATNLLPDRLKGRVAGLNNTHTRGNSSISGSNSSSNSNSRLRINVNTEQSGNSSVSPLQQRSNRGLDPSPSLNGSRNNNIANGIGQRTHQRPPLGSSLSMSSSMSSSGSSVAGSVLSGSSSTTSYTSMSSSASVSSSSSPLRTRAPGLPSSVSPTSKKSPSSFTGSDRNRALSSAGSSPSASRPAVGFRDADGDPVSRPEFVPPAERGINTKTGGAAGMAGVGRRGFTAAVNASRSASVERERPMGPQPQSQSGKRPLPPVAGLGSGGKTVTAAAATSRYVDTDVASVSTTRSTPANLNLSSKPGNTSAPTPHFSEKSNSASRSGHSYLPSVSIPVSSSSYNNNNTTTTSPTNTTSNKMPVGGLPASPRVVRGGGGGSMSQAQGAALRDRSLAASERERSRGLEREREIEKEREREIERDRERERQRERERERERDLERQRQRDREAQRPPPISPIESESEYGGLAYADSTDYEDDDPPPPPPPKANNEMRAPPHSAAPSLPGGGSKRPGHSTQFGSVSHRSRSSGRPADSIGGGMTGSVSGSMLDKAKANERSLAKRSQSQAPGGGSGRKGHTRDDSASSAYSSDDGGRDGGYRYAESAKPNPGSRTRDRDVEDERDRRGRGTGMKAIDVPAPAKKSTRKPKKCLKCAKVIEDGKWVSVDSGGVLCDKCWKGMYLPKCRRCNKPIETQAVSSSDGQLKGKYHKECFNCHICQEPFPDRSFYVFDGRPYCAYHYHEANDSLCSSARCGEPIEGPCAVSHTGARYHPEHMTCEYERPRERGGGRCKNRLDAEYWEVDGKMLCERHAVVAAGIGGYSGKQNGSRRGGSEEDWEEQEERGGWEREREREEERERRRKELKNMKRVTRFIDLKGKGKAGGDSGLR